MKSCTALTGLKTIAADICLAVWPRGLIPPGRTTLICLFRNLSVILAALTLSLLSVFTQAEEVRVAVAANFTETANAIALQFEKETGHKLILSTGSTGQLYTQIVQGAPFDVFLAADQERPQLAIENGFAVAESRLTYALGKLVLYSRDPDRVRNEDSLLDENISKLAIANPVTAPYGTAAIEVLTALDLNDNLASRLVLGNSVTQALQFVATGNADMGFVALSQISEHDTGSYWLVPRNLYTPIAQDAVLLASAAENASARDFMDFLRKDETRAMIEQHGYGLAE